jgi:hypothetical protein
MADVTISDLTTGVPNGSNFIPYTTSSVTSKTLVSSLTAACQSANAIGARVTKATQTGVTANTPTDALFFTTEFDTNGFFDLATNPTWLRVPAGLGGIYNIAGGLTTSTTSAYYRNSIYIIKRASSTDTIITQQDTSIGLNGVDVPMSISCTLKLVAGDVIKLRGNCENFYAANGFKLASLSLVRLGT